MLHLVCKYIKVVKQGKALCTSMHDWMNAANTHFELKLTGNLSKISYMISSGTLSHTIGSIDPILRVIWIWGFILGHIGESLGLGRNLILFYVSSYLGSGKI